jgi:hypothetical protein
MRTITTIGIDLAKKVFQVHGVDAEGKVVVVHPGTAKTLVGPGLVSARADNNHEAVKGTLLTF